MAEQKLLGPGEPSNDEDYVLVVARWNTVHRTAIVYDLSWSVAVEPGTYGAVEKGFQHIDAFIQR